VQSGIGLISGWHCDAERIDIRLDGGRLIPAASGTERADTESVCGDTDNGFGFLINFSALGDGPHTVDIFTDGTWFTSASFSVQTLGGEFIRGLGKSLRLPGFPAEGLGTLLQWQEANQGFVISGVALETEE
jgi:hypothetical protein